MLRRAGTLLARQLNQTRSYSNKVRLVCKMLMFDVLLTFWIQAL